MIERNWLIKEFDELVSCTGFGDLFTGLHWY